MKKKRKKTKNCLTCTQGKVLTTSWTVGICPADSVLSQFQPAIKSTIDLKTDRNTVALSNLFVSASEFCTLFVLRWNNLYFIIKRTRWLFNVKGIKKMGQVLKSQLSRSLIKCNMTKSCIAWTSAGRPIYNLWHIIIKPKLITSKMYKLKIELIISLVASY